MILIDALYINDGGGKVLLDYLISELEKTNKQIFYLLDERVINKTPKIKKSNSVLFKKASLIGRYFFYNQHSKDFSSVLCFGNLPPNIKLSAKVFTYFHQPLFLDLPPKMKFFEKVQYMLKKFVLRRILKYTDFWLVQSSMIKDKLSKKYSIETSSIIILPFYKRISAGLNVNREKAKYTYISNATSHKNHERLIEAFMIFFDKNKLGKLVCTVSNDYPYIKELIERKRNLGYPIDNVGFLPEDKLSLLYRSSEFLIFPSLAESFGLGLIEAVDNGCKIIGADLPYTYAVCEPSLTFNPLSVESIVNALSLSLHNNLNPSKTKVHNQINELITLLK